MNRIRRSAEMARSVALTGGAALGAAVLLAMLAGAALGIRPVVITSGSMEPGIGTGAVVLVRTVPAGQVRVGDVVTVATPTGGRVTHRVVATEEAGRGALLTLRGDANPVADPDRYAVSSAGLVLADVPEVGYLLGAMRTPAGLLVAGGLAAVLLAHALGGGRRGRGRTGGGRHRGSGRRTPSTVGAGAATAIGVAALASPPSTAAWTDPVDASGTSVAAHTVVAPASSSCSSALVTATVSWPGDARYDYEVVLRRVSNGVAVTPNRQITGSDASTTYTGLTDFGLSAGAGTVDFQVEIRSYLAGTPAWRSVGVRTYTYVRVLAVVVGATATCTT